MQEDDFDDYEEMTMVLELDGILDAESVRHAVRTGEIAIRHGQSSAPMVQVGSSVYTGEWMQTLGTDMIFRKLSAEEHVLADCRGRIEKVDESVMKEQFCNRNSCLKLEAVQGTRLISNKAIITRYTNSDVPNGDK